MNRRQFSIAATALAAFPTVAATSHAVATPGRSFDSELARLFSTPQHAIDIGRRYLELNPDKADRRALLNDLFGRSATSSTSRSSLTDLVSRWLERDFRDGVVVVLDGWILARAEASLCALLYLQQGI